MKAGFIQLTLAEGNAPVYVVCEKVLAVYTDYSGQGSRTVVQVHGGHQLKVKEPPVWIRDQMCPDGDH